LYRGIATAVLWVRVKIMSRVASGILAAAAATFAFGAVHLAGASGNTGLVSDRLAQTGLSSVALSNTIVNRQAKSDRAISAQNLERGATIAFEVPAMRRRGLRRARRVRAAWLLANRRSASSPLSPSNLGRRAAWPDTGI
jgi:hypothetical protein